MASGAAIPLPERIPALDGLRAIAILLVLTSHTDRPGTSNQVFILGWTGVDLFFVLSGFLITRILLSTRESPHYFRNFYARRILRIWPVYFGMLLFVYAFERLGFLRSSETAWSWIALASFVQNFYVAAYGWAAIPDWLGPTWSLAIEEQFYLIWPFLVRKWSVATLKKFCMIVILLAPPVRAIVSHYALHEDLPFLLTFCRLDSLCFGTMLALSYWSGDLRFVRWMKRLAIPAIALFVLFMTYASLHTRETALYSLLAIFFAGSLACCLTPQSPASTLLVRICSLVPLRFIGKISYCLYLVHIAVFAIASSHPAQRFLVHIPGYYAQGWTQVAVNWIASIAVAAASWHIYESPILRLKRRFEDVPRPAETRAAAAV
jgi:peptidoglycan/LPS O-acetylase OafA/YrhL